MRYACHVLNNGIISFRKPPAFFYGSGPFPLPRYVLIAPFYGDVDTRNGGETWYTKQVSTDNATLERVKKDIKDVFSGDFDTFSPKYVIIATWYRVGYLKKRNDKVNTFQCVITTDGVQSFAIFLYNEIQWVLEYDPPYPAKVGFSDGISMKSYELPASRTLDLKNITTRSNVGRPGVWVFRIDGENISSTRPITEGVNCSSPIRPINGTIEAYNCTQVGAVIQFHCNKRYIPTKWRTAECQLNGTWAPDPAQLICTLKKYNVSQSIDGENISSTCPITKGVNCTTPTLPINATIEAYNCTQIGAVIQFHCNKSYAPTKWRTAECQLNRTWVPDPAQLICTFKRRSHDSQLLVKYSVISAIAVVFIVGLGAGVIFISIILIKRRKIELPENKKEMGMIYNIRYCA